MVDLSISIEGVFGLDWPAWKRLIYKVEDLGFTGLYLSDHFVMIAPPDYPSLELVVALTYLADHTERVRFGPMVSPLSFRDPVMLARQAAAIDDLSGGRFEFGIGSGYFRMDYDWTGIPFDPPGERLSRFIEAVRLVKSAFTQDTVDFLGEHYTVRGLSLTPKPVRRPWPPLLIGGGGRRVLEFAAREADIVGINIKSTPEGGFDWRSISPAATARKVGWVQEAAGDRFPELELHWLVPIVAITNDPEAAARGFIEAFGAAEEISVADVLASPQALIGSEEAVVEMIQRHREEYGVSYTTVFDSAMTTFAPIVARLAST